MSVASDLRRSITEEKEAERRYRERARYADPKSKRLWLHIAHEESVHAAEFAQRLRSLDNDRDSVRRRK